MDSHTFTTILITTVVTAVAKEVITWLVELVKSSAAASTITTTVKTVFSRRNLSIGSDILILGFYVAGLAYMVNQPGAASRLDVLLILCACIGTLVMTLRVLWGLATASPTRSSMNSPANPKEPT